MRKEKYGTLCGLRRHSIDDGECLPMALCSKISKLTHETQQQLHMNEQHFPETTTTVLFQFTQQILKWHTQFLI